MEEMAISRNHLEVIDVDDPTATVEGVDLSMLPVVRICETNMFGLFSEDNIRSALLDLMMKPCFPSL